MADDPCKECIEKAQPVSPEPIHVSLEWMTTHPGMQRALFGAADPRPDEALTREALALLRWAIRESRAGRVILSGDPVGGDLRRLEMPVLLQAFVSRLTE